MSLIDDVANLTSKKEPPREPESYDNIIYMICRYLAMEPSLMPLMAEINKYLWTIRGRAYLILYEFIPQTSKHLYTKYIKRGALESRDQERIKALQQVTNYSGTQAYVAMKILQKEGIDVDRMLGMQKEKKRARA